MSFDLIHGPVSAELLDKLLQAAQNHGAEEEPDHEAGDLQAIVRSCWAKLTLAQQQEVFEEQADLVTDWGTP